MFTGLVEATGTLAARSPAQAGFRLEVETTLGPLTLGESVSVAGACLTVAEIGPRGFSADVSVETVQRTTLGRLPLGAGVNLERSLALGARLGGHLVLGHVDGVARAERVEPAGDARRIVLRGPPELARFVAVKGSLALDGVSLTVNAVDDPFFEVMLIPHTLAVTSFGRLAPGAELNLEIDPIARYVVRWLEATRDDSAPPSGYSDLAALAGIGK